MWTERADKVTRSVYDANHNDLLRAHQVHQSIVPNDQLSEVLAVVLRNHPSTLRACRQTLSSRDESLHRTNCEDDRIPRNEVPDLDKILLTD